jgi:hypothetical protein
VIVASLSFVGIVKVQYGLLWALSMMWFHNRVLSSLLRPTRALCKLSLVIGYHWVSPSKCETQRSKGLHGPKWHASFMIAFGPRFHYLFLMCTLNVTFIQRSIITLHWMTSFFWVTLMHAMGPIRHICMN